MNLEQKVAEYLKQADECEAPYAEQAEELIRLIQLEKSSSSYPVISVSIDDYLDVYQDMGADLTDDDKQDLKLMESLTDQEWEAVAHDIFDDLWDGNAWQDALRRGVDSAKHVRGLKV